jgi:hypothetical protein
VSSSNIRSRMRGYTPPLPPYAFICWCLIGPLKTESSRVSCYDRRSVGQSVLEQSTHLGPTTRYLLVFDNYGSSFVERPLWREDGSVMCLGSVDTNKSIVRIYKYLHFTSLYTNSVRTSQETCLRYKAQPVNAVREELAVYCENHTEHNNTLCGQNVEF